MQLNNISTIIWDLDGTLIDSFDISEEILLEITSEVGIPMPSRQTRLLNYHGTLDETLKNTLGLNDTELAPVLESFLEKQDKLYEGDINNHLYEDAVALVKKAGESGITQIVLTNRSHQGRGLASPKSIIANSVLANYIEHVICGDEVEFRKPDGRSLDKWLQNNKIKKEDILVIGDQFVDAKLAENLSTRAVLIKRNGDIPHIEEAEYVTIVNSLNDILL